MFINDKSCNLSMASDSEVMLEKKETDSQIISEKLVTEHLLEVYINEVLTFKLICSPQYLPELVLGRLYSEGIIDSVDDAESIYICESGQRAKVYIKRKNAEVKSQENYVETTMSCCTGNHVLNDYFVSGKALSPLKKRDYSKEEILKIAERFEMDSPVHRETGAVHSCYLYHEGKIVFCCEDIGRHNALDKVIGFAIKSGIDLGRCMVYSSGRIPTDMTYKVIRAGIPVLISKSMATDRAVEMARTYNLTLICRARGQKFERML